MITTASYGTLQNALNKINKKYEGNISFAQFEQISKNRIRFRLRVENSHKKGARLGQYQNPNTNNRRHLINACWHAHGDLFDTILQIEPTAVIMPAGHKIYKDKNGTTIGNWIDRNIGSIISPLYYSEACECGEWNY